MRIRFYEAEFDWAFNNPSGKPIGRYIAKKGYQVLVGASYQAGYRTGQLIKSLSMSHERLGRNGHKVIVKATAPHALMHHEGTRPHTIIASNNSKLKFVAKGGNVVYTQMVKHPGTKPNKYLSDQLIGIWR